MKTTFTYYKNSIFASIITNRKSPTMLALFHTWLFCMHLTYKLIHWHITPILLMYPVDLTLMRALFGSYTALHTLAMDRGSPSFLPDSLRPYSTMWEATWPRSKCFSNTAISNLCKKTAKHSSINSNRKRNPEIVSFSALFSFAFLISSSQIALRLSLIVLSFWSYVKWHDITNSLVFYNINFMTSLITE